MHKNFKNKSFTSIQENNNSIRKYFTNENNTIIYKRLVNELAIKDLPHLGTGIDYGIGDICLEESENIFKFYIIDRATKSEYEEFEKIENAIQKLISCYQEYNLVDKPDKMKEIFYDTLNLNSQKVSKNTNKILSKKL